MLPLMFGQSALLPSPPSCRLYTQTRPLISLHIYALYQKQARLSKAQHGPHTIWDCMHAPHPWGPGGSPSTAYTVKPRVGRAAPRQAGPTPRSPSVDICRLFNSPGCSCCKFPLCRYAHVCIKCRHPHPVVECGAGERRGRPRSPPVRYLHRRRRCRVNCQSASNRH